MKVLLIFAHPNPHSVNAALKVHGVHKWQEAGQAIGLIPYSGRAGEEALSLDVA